MCLLAVQIEWQFSRKATVELTHNWGTESDPNFKGYHNGNDEPQGYGHIGLDVPDVAAACKRFSDLGEVLSFSSSLPYQYERSGCRMCHGWMAHSYAPVLMNVSDRICGSVSCPSVCICALF